MLAGLARRVDAMFLEDWRFLTLALAALAPDDDLCPVLELAPKMRYDPNLYTVVNATLYRHFARSAPSTPSVHPRRAVLARPPGALRRTNRAKLAARASAPPSAPASACSQMVGWARPGFSSSGSTRRS